MDLKFSALSNFGVQMKACGFRVPLAYTTRVGLRTGEVAESGKPENRYVSKCKGAEFCRFILFFRLHVDVKASMACSGSNFSPK